MAQPVEYLGIEKEYFENPGLFENGRLSSEDLARQFESQNDLNLYQQNIREHKKSIRLSNSSLIKRYAIKTSKMMRSSSKN